MLSEPMQSAMNHQLSQEMYAAYLYLSLTGYFESESLPGFANWTRVQAQEEITHGMRFFDHINDRQGKVKLETITQPPNEFGSPLEAFKAALAQEQENTRAIHALYELAQTEKDFASEPLLQWFINEQIEEEKIVGQVVDDVERAGDEGEGILMLDRELAERKSEEEGGAAAA